MNSPDRSDEKFSPRIGALCAVAVVFILVGIALVSRLGEWWVAIAGIMLVSCSILPVVGRGPLAKLRIRWQAARVERAELLHLTDRELGDIGLNRLDVRQLIDANWWRDPEVFEPRAKRRRR